jgi:septal ring factor EnvC (AmiA/AmiB activator)
MKKIAALVFFLPSLAFAQGAPDQAAANDLQASYTAMGHVGQDLQALVQERASLQTQIKSLIEENQKLKAENEKLKPKPDDKSK